MSLLSENSSGLCIRCKRYEATRDDVFDYVSNHLIYGILLRIPAEFLLVFKIVCKAWYSIITDSNFINNHRDYHATKDQSIGLVFISGTGNIHNFDMTVINKWHESEYVARILGKGPEKPLRVQADAKLMLQYKSCNGLVWFYTDYPVHMCNPVTREFVKLPKPRTQKGKEKRTGCGFGFDSMRNEYKVVQIYRRLDDSTLEYQVLTLGTSMSWRRPPILQKDKLLHPDIDEYGEIGQGSTFVGGSLYWDANAQILCFDATTEKFKSIPAPKMPVRWRRGYEVLVELDKSLCFIGQHREMLLIYKLQKDCVNDENLWKELYSIDVSRISIPESYIQHCYIQPVCIRSKKVYLRYGNGLACYDAESEDSIAPVVLYNLVADDNRFDFVAYTKSIVCLKDIVGSSLVSVLSDSYI